MLDRETLYQLCQLKLLAKRHTDCSINIERFVNDHIYQEEVLNFAEEQDEEELVFLSISIRNHFGRLQPKKIQADREISKKIVNRYTQTLR